ncbi:hypothetical protein Egran_04164 [Elaphomyces granulatus]|uniref:Pheromone-regulated membrane protein 6 n=1 Tax=Elaphomyces granulatus TaxID=519963 RepID=A0A232LV99_9EURO|nr:hypothetical protein Egran_04164 [Elaphomyces granulatus]
MLCCGDREKIGNMKAEQKWGYINLDDFQSRSCWTPLSYATLWILLFISVAVYAVDTFTAINLLIFSHWAGQINPAISFNISRWIFVGCIIVSFVLLAFRWLRTIRVIKSDSVAESYLDPLTVRVQSIRFGQQGRGWKRFLVYAELTKSKKGADYVALFSYFSFEAWLRIVFADGPRQVVNAVTLYSVAKLNLIPEGGHAAPNGTSPVAQFFLNIKVLADKNIQQALVLLGMLFTLIIWVFAALCLLLSVVLYLLFLFHHIPSEDGTLKRYCRRKINTRLERIVKRKVNKALAKGLALQDRRPNQTDDLGGAPRPLQKAPTLPSLEKLYDDRLPNPSLSRQTTQTTLPPYSRPGTAAPDEKLESFHQPTLPNVGFDDKPPLMRATTQSSAFSDSAALVGDAAIMGYSAEYPVSPIAENPPFPRSHTPGSYTSISRPATAQGRSTAGPPPMDRPGRRPPSRTLPPLDVNVPRFEGDPIRPLPASGSSAPLGPQRNGVYMAFNSNMSNPRVQTSRQNLMRPSTTSPSNEYGQQRPPPPYFHRPSTTSPSNGYGHGRLPPRPPTTAPSFENGYRLPSDGFSRPSTTAPPIENGYSLPSDGFVKPSTTAPSFENDYRLPSDGFTRPSTAAPPLENGYRLPSDGFFRPSTTAPSSGNGYRLPSNGFARASTTPPSNGHGDRPPPRRLTPQRSNTSQWPHAPYDDYEYGRAI